MDAAPAGCRADDPDAPRIDRAWVRTVPNLIVFVASVAIMVIELVASRLVARHLGSSLYTWTSVIGTILAGMSVGNHLGGRIADREKPERILPYLFLAAAALSLMVLWLNEWMGQSELLARLSWPARIFTTVGLVFFAPSCVLGTLSPLVARLALDRALTTGAAIGNVYAWGTAGNILGTFATGFFLLAHFGTRTIVFVTAALLAAIGVSLLVAFRALPGHGFAASAAPATGGAARERSRGRGAPRDERAVRDEEPPSARPARTGRPWASALPNLLVFLSGMSIMVTEMVAGRIVAKELSSSLYTWTSVIGVILSGIALGNYVGGKLADWFSPERILTHLFLLASIMVLTTVAWYDSLGHYRVSLAELFARHRPGDLQEVVDYPLWMRDAERASWPYVHGALARAGLYPLTSYPVWVVIVVAGAFLLPSAALGTISPVVSKFALERSRRSGETIGNIYAWGAAGSIIGTFLPSFFLISWLGTRGLACLTSAALALVSLVLPASGLAHALWAGMALTAFAGATVPPPAGSGENGAEVRSSLASVAERTQRGLIQMGKAWNLRSRFIAPYETESNYFYILVYPSDGGASRSLRLDHLIHGYFFAGKPRRLEYAYESIYASVMERTGAIPVPDPSDTAAPAARSGAGRPLETLFIGGGSYTFPRFVEAAYPGSRIEVAEIDPAVTEAVHAAMFLPRDTSIHTTSGDARNTVDQLLARGERFDFVFGDAANHVTVPWHLTTLEFDQRIARLLKPDGVYLVNILDDYSIGRFLGAFVNTARQTFGGVSVYSTDRNARYGGRDTFVIAMSPRPLDLRDLGSRPGEREFTAWPLADADVEDLIRRSGAMTLTDDFAPVDNLLAPLARTQ